jgi:peptide/nickel transport system substrate-binding protein
MNGIRPGTTALAAIALASVVAACGGSGSSTPTDTGTSSTPATDTGTGGDRATLMKQHRGGTTRLLAKAAGGTLDPQVNYTLQYWNLYQFTYDGLLAFKKVDGTDAFTVVPDLATEIPTPTNDGKTWVFTLRKGIKFSNGDEVTVKDAVASFQRIFKVKSPTAGGFYSGIVGADKCIATPETCTLDGGVVGDDAAGTVTINLKAPDPEFPFKLAVPHASILPAATPPTDQASTPIAGTGAYTFTSFDPNKQLVIDRNPNFVEWSVDAQPDGYPDKIVQDYGLTVEAQITEIENGTADWTLEQPPADRLNELGTKYAEQVHLNPLTAMWYAPMNVNIPPFDNLKARQAVNFAIDRGAAIKIFGGENLATPSCQVLPPGFPGHEDYCPYTANPGTTWTAPDVAKAKQLVQESGTAGAEVAVVVADDEVSKAMGTYLQSVLNDIGYKASVKPISGNIQFTYIQNTKNKVQISVSQWYQDYPAASDFLNVLLGCDSFVKGSDSSINISGFCDKKIDADMKAALALANTDQKAADAQWAQIDKAVTDQAPQATLFNPKHVDVVSKRVGNFKFSAQFYWLVSQSWVQ